MSIFIIFLDTELFGKMDPFVVIKFGKNKFQTKQDLDAGKTP